jgi:hypothetical protein
MNILSSSNYRIVMHELSIVLCLTSVIATHCTQSVPQHVTFRVNSISTSSPLQSDTCRCSRQADICHKLRKLQSETHNVIKLG